MQRPPERPQLPPRQMRDVTPFSRIVPAVGSSRRTTQFATVDLPLPDSPTSPSYLASRERERDAIHGVHDSLRAEERPAGVEVLDEVRDLECRCRRSRRSLRAGMEARDHVPRTDRRAAARYTRRQVPRGQRSTNAQYAGISRNEGTRPGFSQPRPRSIAQERLGHGVEQTHGVRVLRLGEQLLDRSLLDLRPAYMTSTRSATSATMPRSCVMITPPCQPLGPRPATDRGSAPAPSRRAPSSARRRSAARARTAIAIAIITRWHMPPESSCGYSSSRRSRAGMRTGRAARRGPSPRVRARRAPRCRAAPRRSGGRR